MVDGFFPRIKQFFFGEEAGPKARYSPWEVKEISEYYEAFNKYYREFRRDSLVRGCIVTNAFFACMAKGFETALEINEAAYKKKLTDEQKERELKKYAHVKEQIDQLNKNVGMDQILFIAQVKRSIYGKAGFEIVMDNGDAPTRLIPLDSEWLKPELDKNWNLAGYEYKGKKGAYEPRELLYFLNLSLEAGMEGLSDVEPILDAVETRRAIIKRDLKETAHTLWAPIMILNIDTKGMSDEEAGKYVTDIMKQVKPGKSIGVNERVTAQVAELKPDLPGLTSVLEYCDLEIIGNFKVPRYLIGREKTLNRATAYCELETYINGSIANIQRFFKREIERQWYDPQVHRILSVPEDQPLPVLVKHRWNMISATDIFEMAKAVAALWGSHGMGAIGGDRRKVWQLMQWPMEEIEEKK